MQQVLNKNAAFCEILNTNALTNHDCAMPRLKLFIQPALNKTVSVQRNIHLGQLLDLKIESRHQAYYKRLHSAKVLVIMGELPQSSDVKKDLTDNSLYPAYLRFLSRQTICKLPKIKIADFLYCCNLASAISQCFTKNLHFGGEGDKIIALRFGNGELNFDEARRTLTKNSQHPETGTYKTNAAGYR